jgi:hypothetical protein
MCENKAFHAIHVWKLNIHAFDVENKVLHPIYVLKIKCFMRFMCENKALHAIGMWK